MLNIQNIAAVTLTASFLAAGAARAEAPGDIVCEDSHLSFTLKAQDDGTHDLYINGNVRIGLFDYEIPHQRVESGLTCEADNNNFPVVRCRGTEKQVEITSPKAGTTQTETVRATFEIQSEGRWTKNIDGQTEEYTTHIIYNALGQDLPLGSIGPGLSLEARNLIEDEQETLTLEPKLEYTVNPQQCHP